MIGLMPRYVPRPLKKRLPFSRSRKRRLPASSPRGCTPPHRQNRPGPHPAMARQAPSFGTFWEGTSEFPVATVRPRESGARVQYAIGALTRWLVARWSWFKPRSIPVVVATLGMVGIVALSDYLAHHIDQKQPVAAKTSHK